MIDAPFQSGCFRTSQATISYIVGPPNKLPLILIHGIGSRWQPFRPILPVLAKEYHVFALDLRGHGQSSHTPGAYRLVDYTRDIHEFISFQVRKPVVVYGHSLGALIGIYLAAHQPQQICALILGDPPLYYHDTTTRDTIWYAAFMDLLEFMSAHPDPIEMDAWLAKNMPGMSLERRQERVRSLETLDPEAVRMVASDVLMEGVSFATLFPHVTCPVLLLRGNPSLGSALREQDVEFAIRYFSKIRVLEMGTVGHGIIPTSLLAQVMEFISALKSD